MKNPNKKLLFLVVAIIIIVVLCVFGYHKFSTQSNSKVFENISIADEEKDTAEYYKAIKGTVVEQIQNARIPSYDDESKLTQLQQGEILVKEPASKEFPDGVNLWSAKLKKNKNSFVVGDFNNDGLNDVAHIIGYTGFGSGYFYQLTIFINYQGKLKYLTQEELGDRVIIKSVKYNSGLFIVDMLTQGEGDNFKGYCCPNVSVTIKFKLENNQLVEVKNNSQANSKTPEENTCVKSLYQETKPITFGEYPVKEIYTGKSAELDLNSSFIAKRFRSYFKGALSQGADFAGHYAVAKWGFTGVGNEMSIVDVQTGKVYVFPYVAQMEFSYNKDSNLLIVDPVKAICASINEPGSTGMTGGGKVLSDVRTYYFLFENNSFRLLNPQDGQPSKDTAGNLNPSSFR